MEDSVEKSSGKNVAIICYITVIGWIIALLMNSTEKSKLGAFHLRQSLGIMVLAIGAYIVNVPLSGIAYLGWISGLAINIFILVLWIMGLIAAVQAEHKPLPIVGEAFEKWFAKLT